MSQHLLRIKWLRFNYEWNYEWSIEYSWSPDYRIRVRFQWIVPLFPLLLVQQAGKQNWLLRMSLPSIENQKFFKVQSTEILIESSLFITYLFSGSSQTYSWSPDNRISVRFQWIVLLFLLFFAQQARKQNWLLRMFFLLSIANQKFFKVQYTEILIDSSLFITDLFSSSSQTYLAT